MQWWTRQWEFVCVRLFCLFVVYKNSFSMEQDLKQIRRKVWRKSALQLRLTTTFWKMRALNATARTSCWPLGVLATSLYFHVTPNAESSNYLFSFKKTPNVGETSWVCLLAKRSLRFNPSVHSVVSELSCLILKAVHEGMFFLAVARGAAYSWVPAETRLSNLALTMEMILST